MREDKTDIDLAHRFEVYKLAFQHTEGEVGALWKRNDAFLIANSILAVVVFRAETGSMVSAAVAFFCLVLSLLWARANYFSSRWERYWIRECRRLEKEIPGCKIWTQAGRQAGKKRGGPPLKYDNHELYLSLVFTSGWMVILVAILFKEMLL